MSRTFQQKAANGRPLKILHTSRRLGQQENSTYVSFSKIKNTNDHQIYRANNTDDGKSLAINHKNSKLKTDEVQHDSGAMVSVTQQSKQ